MRNVLITGTSSGIGFATARHFEALGDRVFAAMRTPEAGGLSIDVDSDESVREGVTRVLLEAGHIDVLVNNAGIGGRGPVELRPIERAKATFETNYFGAVRMMQAVLPGMRERRSGTIVNVTSMAGRVALAGHGHYAASKHALEALSEIVAAEVKPFGIRVAIIEPGVVLTPLLGKSPAMDAGPYEMPMRRLQKIMRTAAEHPATVEDVARAIEFAVTTDQPKLRYLVGRDAEAIVPRRRSISDEEWIGVQAIEDDDEFYRRMPVWPKE